MAMWKRWTRKRQEDDDDVADELRSHLSIQAAEQSARGAGAQEAAAHARRELGNTTRIREEIYEQARWTPLESFVADVRFGARLALKTPVWSAAVIGSLTFGIALATKAFSLFYSLLLKPLPYREPEELVTIWTLAPKTNYPRLNASPANWRDWRESNRVFTDIGIVKSSYNYNLAAGGEPERIRGARISANMLSVLRVRPFLGRAFTPAEVDRDAPLALIGFGLWTRRFGSDPSVVGRKIDLNGRPVEVIGIMPEGFAFPSRDFELWAPAYIEPAVFEARVDNDYQAIARLKPGITMARAQSELSVITRRISAAHPALEIWLGRQDVLIEPLLATTSEEARRPLTVVLMSVMALLAIACLNAGVLLSLRASSRARELALRSALGARTGRLVSQLFGEIVPLAFAASLGAVLLSFLLVRLAASYLPINFPRIEQVGVHEPVLLFSLAVCLSVLLLVGLVPGMQIARQNQSAALGGNSRSVTGGSRMRRVLMVAQVALSLTLLLADGLLLRSLANLFEVHPGFSTEKVLTAHFVVSRARYKDDAQASAYLDSLVRRVRNIPGVTAAGIVNRLPFSGTAQTGPIEFASRAEAGPIDTDWRSATPGYFEAIGIPLLRGRLFNANDTGTSLRCGLIDEQLALRMFGSVDAVGQRFRMAAGSFHGEWTTVVGIVGHIHNDGPGADPRPQIYLPETQRMQDRAALVLSTSGEPMTFANRVKQAIYEENPGQALYDVKSMRQWLKDNLQSRSTVSFLLGVFACGSLALACLGLYAVLADSARQRTREFGIRLALGATQSRIASLLLREAGTILLAGSVAGLALASLSVRPLRSFLFGVTEFDGVTLLTVPLILAVTALAAAFKPALSAARTDPSEALRTE